MKGSDEKEMECSSLREKLKYMEGKYQDLYKDLQTAREEKNQVLKIFSLAHEEA